MPNLDDTKALLELDTDGMFDAAWSLAEQCTEAWGLSQQVALPEQSRPVSQIVVTGLGGSAIGGDLLRVFGGPLLPVPVLVNRDYTLPRYVGEDTLVFVVSYSGNTEETLSAYDEAKSKGATIVAITTGGKLGARAAADGFPVVQVPGGIAPRSATGYLFIPTLGVLERMGFLRGMQAEVEGLVAYLQELREKYGPANPTGANPAKDLAGKLYGRLPVIWGASGTTEVVAMRWKGQVNENAKTPAYWNVFPELNHNEVVGLEKAENILASTWFVFLHDPDDHPRVKMRMDITKRMMAKAAGCTDVEASGPNRLARLYSLIYLGDYTSLYLAALYGINPGPVKVIDFLKAELAKRP
ncbi:MAG: bifunctional phosphoglucose/phosphomannose isomerase [Peptococcaceae bacterium]|nr:bifunctional phosphoglucose/phosphomannose isomerase [Peptococcaceae bacterium]